MIMDQNKEHPGRFMSYAVETKGAETEEFAQALQEKYAKEYAEELAAFKKWQKRFMAAFEQRR